MSDITEGEFKALLNKLTEGDLNKVQEELYMRLNNSPPWYTGAKKIRNIESFVWWARGHKDRVALVVDLANQKIKAKSMLPLRGPVPGTHYMYWKDFTQLSSYASIAEAVNFGNPLRKALPYTKDGYVSVDCINNIQRWADWKLSSLSDYERNLAYSLDSKLGLASLRKLNWGRRTDQPLLLPDNLLL
jgi:hypothetical protein